MRSSMRHGSKLTFHPIVIASAIVFVVLFLALGYHSGVNHVDQAFKPRLEEIALTLKTQEKERKSCNREMIVLTNEVAKSNSHLKALQSTLKRQEKEQNLVQASYKNLEVENIKCEAERTDMSVRIKDMDAQDEQTRLNVEQLVKEVDVLQASILRITNGEGMSIVLLNEVHKSLRANYAAHCRKVPGCVELTDEDLLKMHVESNVTVEEIKKFLERDAEAQKNLANSLQGPSANLTGVYFLPSVVDEQGWDTAAYNTVYFKRSSNQRPLHEVKKSASAIRVAGNVIGVLEAYSDYAMCAYRLNNPKFSFPSLFSYTPEAAVSPSHPTSQRSSFLHELLVSPLLRYCIECDSQGWKNQYQLACFKNRMLSLHNYGTHDFWVVRSMIRAAPPVQTEALNFYESHDMDESRVLAVVLHLASESDREDCDRAASIEYRIHYQYLMANFPNESVLKMHVAAEREAQCSPTPNQIIEHIERVRTATTQSFEKIYLSVSAETRSHIDALLSAVGNTELSELLLPAYTNPEKEAATPGFTELVDLEIASRATDILVSPFMRASRYVTEQYLLRHQLSPDGHVWVF